MRVFQDIITVRKEIQDIRKLNKSIGLVPTMGALHDGHFSLIKASKSENDITIVSIFVNPLQFNNPDDLTNYPSNIDEDLLVLDRIGCNLVFAPAVDEMYPQKPVIKFSFGEMENIMEGAFRPGHFSGVALVVMKLFSILQPTRAYFGQKDLQQFKVIEQMVYDTSTDVILKMMPIIREKSGLALSSRNNRLSKTGREIAAHIYKALCMVADSITKGNPIKEAIVLAENHLDDYPEIKLEYLTVVNLKNLQAVKAANGSDQVVLCFAGYIDEIRLIDNLIINSK